MAEVQYAPMSYDKFYSPRRINSAPNFDHLTYPPQKQESFEARMASAPSTATDSPRNSLTSISTVSSCGSYFDTASNQSSIDPYEAEDTFSFPTYDDYNTTNSDKPTFIHLEQSIGDDDEEDPPASPTNTTIPKIVTTSELPVTAIDDITLQEEPSRHVDYLSHNWKEEDIWASWRYMIGKRKVYDNAARLENASWRTWMKAKNNLKTVSPEKLNWMKDYDVTWLYGPLSTAPERSSFSISPVSPGCSSAPRIPCHHHKNTKKTILKKRSMSEALLQRSISSSNLLKQATASIRSQQSQNHHRLSRPVMPNRAVSDYATYPFVSHMATTNEGTSETTSVMESGVQSPSSSRKHIHFNDRVEQCIAVEAKEEDEEIDGDLFDEEEEDSSDEGGLFLNMSGSRPKNGGRQNSRSSVSEPQTIQKLPSTTLKAEVEPSELKQSTSSNNLSALLFGASPSSSSKLNPGSGNAFMFNEDEDDDPIEWEPKWTNRKDSVSLNRGRFGDPDEEYGGFPECPPTPPSGNEGIFGRAVDAVNTARDIAHVFWNVGWAGRR
ncbi:hypothetical protein H072_5179 [Dactylellina haptotyla CBS 200.50]|uniref:Nitrogen regulatory protein areA GATA-like domain-containing protein n=1 Tax=Dactylellina haptotyla (strain CBS 200.50) TaxID=1284197 RepID=S8AD40_DACHA|nr:hypothetical protein H072_5179 [Dactylellina haptotyla CBS 200.50]